MNILAQLLNDNYNDFHSSELKQVLEKLISPLEQNPSLNNYVEIVEELDKASRKLVISIWRDTLERMDYAYRHSPGRIVQFYVKQKRQRSLITVFGELTYSRTEYVHRTTKEPFCYVDWILGLRKKERYDPCVQSLIIEGYCDNNSMIKVGKLVGDRISGSFNRQAHRDTAIPRQTVYNILKRFDSIELPILAKEVTPETLYVMADDKFISLQKEEKRSKAMTKAAVIFEEIQAIIKRDGSPSKRHKITNKTVVLSAEGSIWDRINDILYQMYDLDKVKRLYLMGDGANWLKHGVSEVRLPNGKTIFALDRFHFKQAINRLTSDLSLRQMLYDYSYHNMKKEFHILANSIKEANLDRQSIIEENLSYLLKHWNAYQIMNKAVIIGCPMEQAISHILASHFTSVPKAYSLENLSRYFSYRELHQNGYDVRNVIIQAMSLQKNNNKNIVIPAQEYDFSIFEKKSYPENPTIREFNRNIITAF